MHSLERKVIRNMYVCETKIDKTLRKLLKRDIAFSMHILFKPAMQFLPIPNLRYFI